MSARKHLPPAAPPATSRQVVATVSQNCVRSMRVLTPKMGPRPIIGETACKRGFRVLLPCGNDGIFRKSGLKLLESKPARP